ncbi:hypothetical protein D3C81_2014220 [compost metagenome]
MLLQSHLGEISLLPALPAGWKDGRIQGLKARGGFVLDLEWRDHVLVSARIAATHDGILRLSYPRGLILQLPDGSMADAGSPLQVKAGEVYLVTV